MITSRFTRCVRRCLDSLLAHGTDRYGAVHTPMIMSIIDVRTNESPREPLLLDGYIRGEERPGRRNPGGCDLWDDQPLLHALYQYSILSGDDRYARAADDYIRAYFTFALKPNGMIAWGSHLYYNTFTGTIDDDGFGHWHEMLVYLANWDAMWRVDEHVVRREIEGIWKWHIVDKATGQHNRHDDPERHDDANPGCDFSFSGGCFAHAFAFLFLKTGERVWLDRAKLVVNWHWTHRNPKTNLPPDAPSTGDRYDAQHCFTIDVGPHVAAVLRCYEMTDDRFFRDVSLAYLHAWQTYAWDEDAGLFHAALQLNGTPVPEQPKGGGYDVWMPTGYADTWPTTMYGYDSPLAAAQTCVAAWELTGDPAVLDGARCWARHIRASMPPTVGRRWINEIYAAMPQAKVNGGAYAEGYGRAIDFFVSLHRATGLHDDLVTAVQLADEAMEKLSDNGWLKGHAGKPYYETTDGVGTLLVALLELAEATR